MVEPPCSPPIGRRSQVSCTISSGDMPIDIQWRKDGRVFAPGPDVQV